VPPDAKNMPPIAVNTFSLGVTQFDRLKFNLVHNFEINN